ncbi:SHOCT domain-containing protein [Stieleria varia]|uniref:SHOCT domain-containing protein n=1 Tax=Stieleria varia TaxID=2528005 RepID=A0A5C6ASV3_9BACT|nr:SHOCT domain-containing protein [Stieleria varia]TWU02359.1 hypothetical protein Pla52n_34090 [Stieleria varia]
MQQLSPEGEQLAENLSRRYGFSLDAIRHMMVAVYNGNGSMAQFNHPEFGGSGQWMQGGMTMVGDMFNNSLKGSVSSICGEISSDMRSQPGMMQSGSFQSQSQGGSGHQAQSTGGQQGQSSLFVPDPESQWWPSELGSPNSLGSQNNVRYAYFAGLCRLAVKTGNEVWVYDTLDHHIGGFSQQQGMGSSITFTSQYGVVNLSALPVVSRNGQSVQTPPIPAPMEMSTATKTTTPEYSEPASGASQPPSASSCLAQSSDEILHALSKLGDLKSQGILTEDEFNAKKADLLSRL